MHFLCAVSSRKFLLRHGIKRTPHERCFNWKRLFMSTADFLSFVPDNLAGRFSRAKVAIECIKYTVFTIVVAASTLVILTGIASRYCILKFHPIALYVLLFLALLLLAYVEALHYANVSVEKWDMAIYQQRYPRACKVQKLVNTNEKLQRFLVGRQFFVIFVVFIIAQVTTLPGLPEDYLGLPEDVVAVLLGSGLPGIMLVLNIGQLVPQLFVEEYTLQFMNMFGCYFVTQLSFFAEYIGVCNFSWLLFHAVDYLVNGGEADSTHRMTCINIPGQMNLESVDATEAALQEPLVRADEGSSHVLTSSPLRRTEHHSPGNSVQYDDDHTNLSLRIGWFDILKHIWSTGVTLFSLFVVCYGISQKYSVLSAPVPALFLLFAAALTLLFYLEGLMICIVSTQYWDPEDFRESHPRAFALHKLVNKPDLVKRFIVGRQFFTLLTNFLLAQITVFSTWSSEGYDPVLFFIFIRSGLVGVLIVLAFAQLLPELLAARHPVAFMNFYGAITIVRLSLIIESLGVGHCAWFLFYSTRGFLCGSESEKMGDKLEETHSDPSLPANVGESNETYHSDINITKSYGTLSSNML